MINQHLAGVHIAAACEAMALGIRAGIDPRQLFEVISSSAGASWMFNNRVPHILEGDYQPRSAVDIFVKDSGNCARCRASLDLSSSDRDRRPSDVRCRQRYGSWSRRRQRRREGLCEGVGNRASQCAQASPLTDLSRESRRKGAHHGSTKRGEPAGVPDHRKAGDNSIFWLRRQLTIGRSDILFMAN